MTDIFLRLNDDWSLGADSLQWILYRRRERKGHVGWRPIRFIASNKLDLMQVLRETRCSPSDQALRSLNQLPETFREWRMMVRSRSAVGHRNSIPETHHLVQPTS